MYWLLGLRLLVVGNQQWISLYYWSFTYKPFFVILCVYSRENFTKPGIKHYICSLLQIQIAKKVKLKLFLTLERLCCALTYEHIVSPITQNDHPLQLLIYFLTPPLASEKGSETLWTPSSDVRGEVRKQTRYSKSDTSVQH